MNNFLVSSDEERRINDILDRGINEFQHNTILKSSIVNNDYSNPNNANNYLNETNELTNRREYLNLKNSNSDNSNLNLNLNYNYSSFPNISELHHLPNFPNEHNNYKSYDDLNTEYDPNVNLDNRPNNSQIVKSSALKRLLNEMKTNKYLSTSEDESDYNKKFKGVSASSTHNINNKNKSIEDLDENPNINVINAKNNFSYNQNLIKNSTSTSSNNMTKNKINLNKADKDLIFQDVKCDIKSLQEKINGLEKKLIIENDSNKKKDGQSKYLYSEKKNYNKIIQSDDEIISSKRLNRFIKNNNIKDSFIKSHSNKKTISNTSKSSFTKLNNSERSSKIFNYNKDSSIFHNNKLDLESKFQKLKVNYDNLKSTLIKEKQKVIALDKQNEKRKKKEELYDDLFENNKNLNNKYKETLISLEQSNLIRKEQSKLIKSLQREIDILRGNFAEESINTTSKLIEEYKDIRKDLNEEREALRLFKKPVLKKKKKTRRSTSKSLKKGI